MVKVTVFAALLIILCGCTKPPADGASSRQPLSGAQAQGKAVSADYRVAFPRDHASHPDYAIEWWYVTANLRDDKGLDYAMQWTLFRFKTEDNAGPWADAQQYMAHAKLSYADQHLFEERFARGNVGNAGVSGEPFTAYLDDWRWQANGDDLFPAQLSFRFASGQRIELRLERQGPYILHGEQGYSRKLRDSQQASMYYSQPFIDASATFYSDAGTVNLTGSAWFDHEWTSQYMSPQSLGWDWFSLHLDNGDKLMLFNMRHAEQPDFWSGSYIFADGSHQHLSEEDIEAQVDATFPVAGRRLPLHWRIHLKQKDVNIQVRTTRKGQWNQGLFSYYEGAVTVSGTHSGVGFMELTGYTDD